MAKTLETLRSLALAKKFGVNKRGRPCLGPLHEVLTNFLPEFIDENEKFCNLKRVAMAIDYTYAGLHRCVRPGEKNRITAEIARRLIALSALTEQYPPGFRPAKIEDFWEYVRY